MATKNISSSLPLDGGTMTGSLVLNDAPTTNYQAASKSYIDTLNTLYPATKADMLASVATNRFLTPAVQKYHLSSVIAWVRFATLSSSSIQIINSFGIASVTGPLAYSGSGQIYTIETFDVKTDGYTAASAVGAIEYPNDTTTHIIMNITGQANSAAPLNWIQYAALNRSATILSYPLVFNIVIFGKVV